MSIHQEALIAASPPRVFELLANGTLFGAATGMPAAITDREGEPFWLFGGRVEGKQIELVPGRRVVSERRVEIRATTYSSSGVELTQSSSQRDESDFEYGRL